MDMGSFSGRIAIVLDDIFHGPRSGRKLIPRMKFNL
jgi:hypothetical protein